MLTTSKRILVFSLAYHPVIGGAEVAVKEITDRIFSIEFDVITMRFSSTHLEKEKIGNCTIYRINSGPGYLGKIFFVPMVAFRALKLNREKKYDALWAIMTYMLFPIVLLRFFGNRTPYVLTLQDGDPFEHVFKRLRIRIFLPLLKYGFRHANKVQAISNFLAGWARQMGYRGKVEVIPNGVDVEKFKNQKSKIKIGDTTTLITTSRLVEKNAVRDVIEAMKFLPESVTFKILGTGPLEKNLKFKIKNLKLEGRVEMLGFVKPEDIPKYLHQSDIFIRPSLSEGMGNSFIEAMAAGLPVIATPVGGIIDFLRDPSNTSGQAATGLFCEVKNPRSIAEQVRRLLGDDVLRQRLVENAQKMVKEKYDWNLIAREMKIRVFDPAMTGQVK